MKRKFTDYVIVFILLVFLAGTGVMYIKNNTREIPFFYIENTTNKEAVVEVTYYLYQDEETDVYYRKDTLKYTVKPYQAVECVPPVTSKATHVIRWKAELTTEGLLIGSTEGNLYGEEAFNQYNMITEQ